MARAAAKRNKRPRQVARPQAAAAQASVKRDKALEDQLFFGRLRGHAKWAFVLLAIIFAGGFVFLGVGSGSGSGLSDVFNNIFTGSSGPSISKLQDKVAKNPRDAAAFLELAQALQGKQRTDEAIAAYQQYVALRPKSIQGLTSLAALYNAKAQTQYREAQSVASTAQSADPGKLLGSSPFTGTQNSVSKTLADQSNQQLSTAYSSYLSTVQESLGVYQKIAKLTPDEPSALINVAQTAQLAGESQTELTAYQSFLKRFPDDPLAPDVRRQVKQLEKSVTSAGKAG